MLNAAPVTNTILASNRRSFRKANLLQIGNCVFGGLFSPVSIFCFLSKEVGMNMCISKRKIRIYHRGQLYVLQKTVSQTIHHYSLQKQVKWL